MLSVLSSLISLTLIWWQGLFLPAQWHKVWNPLTYSTFNRGFPHLSAEVLWSLTSRTHPKCGLWFHQAADFPLAVSESVKLLLRFLLVWQRSGPKEWYCSRKIRKKSLFSLVWDENQREESWQGFYGVKKQTCVSAALILKTGFACSRSGGVAMHLFS